jgi:hypothetical protein
VPERVLFAQQLGSTHRYSHGPVVVSRISAGPVVAILAATAALAVLVVLAVSYALYLRGRR